MPNAQLGPTPATGKLLSDLCGEPDLPLQEMLCAFAYTQAHALPLHFRPVFHLLRATLAFPPLAGDVDRLTDLTGRPHLRHARAQSAA
jgi:hypothetical protein